MAEVEDGGPAFPTDVLAGSGMHGRNGMSQRDWFAGQALGQLNFTISGSSGRKDAEDLQQLAIAVYRIADAMLAERSKK